MAYTAAPSVFGYPSPVPPPLAGPARALQPSISADVDVQDGGNYRVVGTTEVEGSPDTPVFRKVVLHDQLSGRVVRATWSHPVTGVYAFERIRLGVFYIVSFDHTGLHRGVIADNYTSESMP